MRTIMIDGATRVACPKCSHHFPLTDGLSRQAIERHAEEFERALAERKKALERELAAETKRQFEIELKAAREAAQRQFDDERRRIDAQYKVQLESAQREAADLKRKLESGAAQFQGEGLEVSLEALLRAAFPLDEIVPVPKGMNGADLLQRVRAPSGACWHHHLGGEADQGLAAALAAKAQGRPAGGRRRGRGDRHRLDAERHA